jgi:hypothetical protein
MYNPFQALLSFQLAPLHPGVDGGGGGSALSRMGGKRRKALLKDLMQGRGLHSSTSQLNLSRI